VSTQRGSEPRWRRDGKELFYLAGDNMLTAVDVNSSGDALRFGAERALFSFSPIGPPGRSTYDVAPDGRFIVASAVRNAPAGQQPLTILVNWPGLLKK